MDALPSDIVPIATALERSGWCLLPAFFDVDEIAALAAECREFDRAASLRPAATGHGATHARNGLRGDRTRWFEAQSLSSAQTRYWARMDALRHTLNRTLLLGLDELEAHYALYPPGAGYARHRDCFRDDDARVLSTVVYLNEAWQAHDGGALRLHLSDGARDIAPHGGSLVLFLSAEVEHEVLPATRDRLSIAGWFRRRPAR